MNRILATALLVVAVCAILVGADLNERANQPDVVYRYLVLNTDAVNTKSLNSANLAGNTTYANVASEVTAVIKGVFTTIAATNTVSMVDPDDGVVAQPVTTYCKYLVSSDGTTYSVYRGRPSAAAATAFYPKDVPTTMAVVGGIQIYTASAAFTPGTSSLASTGYTVTYTNLSHRPLTMTDL